MKITEIIAEATLRKGAVDATPDMQKYPALNNNNSPYAAYRFGIALAGAPDYSTDKSGPIAGDFVTIGYTDADKEILAAASKMMGVDPVQETSEDSIEVSSVNKQSVTRAAGPITLKSKK